MTVKTKYPKLDTLRFPTLEINYVERFVFCDSSTVSIPRIRELMELSIATNKPFHNLNFHKVEIFDEYSIVSERVRGVSKTVYKTSLERDVEYILTYIDGELVEVNSLIAEKVIFRNMTPCTFAFCGSDYLKTTPFWIDIDEIIGVMEQEGEFLRIEPEAVDYIRQHPDHLVPYTVGDNGIIDIPKQNLFIANYTPEMYAELVGKSIEPVGVNYPMYELLSLEV